MITRVLLRNWRGYEKLSLDFGPGLTFVIADNGVGKTSLVNGVAWAIFGEASGIDGAAAIRAGSDRTVAEVDLSVGDTRFTVTRTLARASNDRAKGRHTLDVSMDGTPTVSVDLTRRLSEVATLPPDVLPQLMFVPEMRLTHEGELFADVQDHLAALLGIDDLRQAVRTAEDVARSAGRQLREAKEIVRVSAATVDTATARVSRLTDELRSLDQAITADMSARSGIDATLRRLDEWTAYDERLARYESRLDELADQARAIGLSTDAEEVATAAQQLTDESRQVNADLAGITAEEGVVLGLLEQLGSLDADESAADPPRGGTDAAPESSDAVCPVCLQPVDDDAASHAAAAHRARLAELEVRQVEIEERRIEVDAAAQQIVALASALVRQRPPTPPTGARPDHDEPTLLGLRTELDDAIAAKNSRKGALGEQLRQAEETIVEAEKARTATDELTRLHATVATASALADLAGTEADARTERSLVPISQALADRWSEHFVASPARPRLAGGGTIELGQGDVAIPYSSFSGGEKTLASLLTRLLFVTSATGLRSMWLDEPLEHLDPANRTRVARLLAQVTRPGSHLAQVVCTTYEEGLARSMVDRHEATTIAYVSTDDLL